MHIYKATLALAIFAGLGTIAIRPTCAASQAQDQHQQGGEKPAQGHPARPAQQSHAARPQQKPAARPQQKPAARSAQQSHAARPAQQSRPQAAHTARPTTQQNRSSHAARPASNARPQPQSRPQTQPQRGSQANRGSQSRPQANRGSQGRPNYQFRSQDTGRLRQYYQGGFGRIDRRHRPRFNRGGYVPRTYWGDFQPVPASLIGYLPAVPPGYAIGYYDGYVVVYDPSTYLIVSVLDILQ